MAHCCCFWQHPSTTFHKWKKWLRGVWSSFIRGKPKLSGAHTPLDLISSHCSAFNLIQIYESCLHCCSTVNQHQKFTLPDGAPALSYRGGLNNCQGFLESFNIRTGTKCLQNQCQLITFAWGLCRLRLLIVWVQTHSLVAHYQVFFYDSATSQIFTIRCHKWHLIKTEN